MRAYDWDAASPEAFASSERVLLMSGNEIGAASRITRPRSTPPSPRASLIAYTSIPNPSDDWTPIVVAPEHRATEEHIRAAGTWAMLRNNICFEIQVPAYQAALATGRHMTEDEQPVGFVARADCARAAAAVLAGGAITTGASRLTGSEASVRELAAISPRLGGEPVEPSR